MKELVFFLFNLDKLAIFNLKSEMIINKKVSFEYNIINTWNAGVALKGTEVKSLRMGVGSIVGSYAVIQNGEVILHNMHIPAYKFSVIKHQETAKRKLLLNRKEINKMMKSMDKHHTLIPTEVFFNDKNYVKIKIALCIGKKTYDKRHAIKERENNRERARQTREVNKSVKLKVIKSYN